MIKTFSKLGSVQAISLKYLNATKGGARRQMLTHRFLDLDVALGELLSVCSMVLD